LFGKRLTEPLLDAAENDIEWRGSVKLLRDEVLHLAEAEESPSGRILYDDGCAVPGRLRPNNEISAELWHR
jgi:hypothetical protein